MAGNYWSRKRFSRRAVVRGGALGLAGLGGAALIGCGSGDEEEVAATSSGSSSSSSAATAAATQALQQQQAAAAEAGILTSRQYHEPQTLGGIFKGITQAEPEQVDPLQATSYKAAYYSRWAYQTLLEFEPGEGDNTAKGNVCLLYTSPSPRDGLLSRMPSSA